MLGKEYPGKKPEKIKFLLDQYGLNTSDILYIGDLASDILYCRDVGIDIVAVGYGYHPVAYLQQFSPTFLVEEEQSFIQFLLQYFSHQE